MDVLEMSPQPILLNFLITWIVGLTPALIARYAIYKRPLSRKAANWIAGLGSVSFWLLFQVLNAVAGEQPGRGIVWILVFFVSRWLMTRGGSETELVNDGTLSRSQMRMRLREIISDPNTSDGERWEAQSRLEALEG